MRPSITTGLQGEQALGHVLQEHSLPLPYAGLNSELSAPGSGFPASARPLPCGPSPRAPHLHSLLLLSPLFFQQAALLLGQDFDEAFTHHGAHLSLLPGAGPTVLNDGI